MTFDAFKTAEKEGWNARAADYNDFTGQVTTGAIPTLLAMAEIAPGKHMLDLCCGTGRAAGAALALGARAEGVDVSSHMVEAAKAAFPAGTFEVGDAEAIPKADGLFDAVLCAFGVMHVGSPEVMFAEMARVLKPGGRVALSHWVGPPQSPFFKLVFGAMQQLADMSVVPPSPPPFALSTEDAMRNALESAGFRDVRATQIPLVFRAPKAQFAEHFRQFAARAAIILDAQTEPVLKDIYAAWDAQLEAFAQGEEVQVPMPALAVSATRHT